MTSVCDRFPQTQNISHGVWEESKRIHIQSQSFAFFLPSLPSPPSLPPPLPSFFLKSPFLISFLQTKKFKIPVARPTTRKPSRRGSTLSLSRTSGGSSPQSSMVSVNPGSDEPPSVVTQATGSKDIEDNESSSTKPEEEPLHVGKSCLRPDQSAPTLPWSQTPRAPQASPLPPRSQRKRTGSSALVSLQRPLCFPPVEIRNKL